LLTIACQINSQPLIQDGVILLPLFVMAPFRWLYWTDTSTINPKIERASMDGTSRTVLHNTSLIFPSGITLDYTSQTLYWIDAARLRIESSGVDGSNRRTITTVNANNPWGIVYYSGNLYWTERNSNRSLIYTSSASFPSPRNLLSGFTLNFFPLGIEVVSSSRQLQGKLFTIKSAAMWWCLEWLVTVAVATGQQVFLFVWRH